MPGGQSAAGAEAAALILFNKASGFVGEIKIEAPVGTISAFEGATCSI